MACGQFNPRADAISKAALFRLLPGKLVLAASDGDIPSIQVEEENFVQVEKADLEDADLVVCLLIGGGSRAYPVRLLSLHEVVNGRAGDKAVAITWCPLYCSVVFDRTVDGT